jgi:hypothetical protein
MKRLQSDLIKRLVRCLNCGDESEFFYSPYSKILTRQKNEFEQTFVCEKCADIDGRYYRLYHRKLK